MSSISIGPGPSAAGPALAGRLARLRELRPGVIIAGAFVTLSVIAVIAPSVLAGSPYTINLAGTLRSPSWAHIFGTDQSGRDLYARIIFGARESLLIGLGATALSMGIG